MFNAKKMFTELNKAKYDKNLVLLIKLNHGKMMMN